MPAPPPKAERKGTRPISSPVPDRIEPRRIVPAEDPAPEALDSIALPQIFAPLVAAAADQRDLRGLTHQDESEAAPAVDRFVLEAGSHRPAYFTKNDRTTPSKPGGLALLEMSCSRSSY